MNKNLSLLALSQVFGFTANIITVFLSGIVGSQITSIKSLSTLPTSLTVLGTAIFTILAAKIMGKIGRKLGFIFGALVSSATCLLAVLAITQQNFVLFCISISSSLISVIPLTIRTLLLFDLDKPAAISRPSFECLPLSYETTTFERSF